MPTHECGVSVRYRPAANFPPEESPAMGDPCPYLAAESRETPLHPPDQTTKPRCRSFLGCAAVPTRSVAPACLQVGQHRDRDPGQTDPEASRKMLRRMVGERIKVPVDCAPDLWHVKADPGKIGRAFMNLWLNARDAMP